ncbi:pyruvate, phosphate dikinase [Kribbella sandramycini]|uniref:Pyruvate, phosphate dikinase n=1 Tax=Kribbella sandramycini TaxID=60450 RepID=A0A7Y4NYB9_9ACTN|nr:pyruvate, phosphate dikinase [Kribbella sandramycini]
MPLQDAGAAAGPKAATLGRLLRAGFPVPPGRVVLPGAPVERVPAGLYAVRSSASTEDGVQASAAGQYETFLNVSHDDIPDRVADVRASLSSQRAVAYRGAAPAEMAVIVQQQVDADVSGVMFTGPVTEVEAFWGLGDAVVGGLVNPDAFTLTDDSIERRGSCLSDEQLRELQRIGIAVEKLLGGPQDIEFAFAQGGLWLLQARPVTAPLEGTGGSAGTATGPARVVRGADEFGRVRPGDILVCRFTDPSWTPLFGVIAGIVTETGGRLSHAAIVARERRIPAVLGVPGVLGTLRDGSRVSIDGTAGSVRQLRFETEL